MNTAQVCLLLFFGVLIGFALGWGLCTAWCGRRVRRIARSFCRNCGVQRPHTADAAMWMQYMRAGEWPGHVEGD